MNSEGWNGERGVSDELRRIKANSHIACRAHAVSLPCRAALIHTCHAAPLLCSDSAVSFMKVRVVAGNIRTASLNSVTDRLLCSVLIPLFTVVGMDCCVNETGKTQSKPLAARHGCGMGTVCYV